MQRSLKLGAGVGFLLLFSSGLAWSASLEGWHVAQSTYSSTVCMYKDSEAQCWGEHPGELHRRFRIRGIRELALSSNGGCLIDSEGLKCWRDAEPYNAPSLLPTPVGLSEPSGLAAGRHHYCVTDHGQAYCWGSNDKGASQVPTGLGSVDRLFVGDNQSCAILSGSGGRPRCWGSGASIGQMPLNLVAVQELALNDWMGCAIDMNGLRCWGTSRNSGVLTPPPVLSHPQGLVVDERKGCASGDAGIQCWNGSGEIAKIPQDWKALQERTFTSDGSLCGLNEAGVACWTRDLKPMTPEHKLGRTPLAFLIDAPRALFAAFNRTCALVAGGIKCWGAMGYSSSPAKYQNGERTPLEGDVRQVAITTEDGCALAGDRIKCWGAWLTPEPREFGNPLNNVTLVANGNRACALHGALPEQVCWGLWAPSSKPLVAKPKEIILGPGYHCALGAEQLACEGQIATPPYKREQLVGASLLRAGSSHACLVLKTGVSCWGDERNGRLNVPAHLKQPTEMGLGNTHGCAIQAGRVICWGGTQESEFGESVDFGQTRVPRGLRNPRSLAVGHNHNCVLTDDGIRCWGDNHLGQTRSKNPENFPMFRNGGR